jgi:hypothetical protein
VGFYVRKSVKAGPFRFNLSKSGIGISAGVPGFRIGTGPRGNYIHMGRNGIYYRASLNASGKGPPVRPRQPPQHQQPAYLPSGVVMEDVTGATAMSLEPTGRGDLVDQLNHAAARFVWWWPVAIVVFLLGILIMPWGLIVWVLGAVGCVWLYFNDQARRTVVLFYDVHDDAHSWFESVVTQWRWLTESQRVWRIIQSGDVVSTYGYKVNAGASSLVNRISSTASTSDKIKQLATNVAIPSLTAGRCALYLLPDRLLVRDGKHYSDVNYRELRVFHQEQRFIECSTVPRDAVQVDSTWQYVNVKGGPDRRFKNNRILPIMLYGQIVIASAGGLYWIIQTSRAGVAEAISQVISSAPGDLAALQGPGTVESHTSIASSAQKTTKVRCFNCGNIQDAPVNASAFECENCHVKLKRATHSSD